MARPCREAGNQEGARKSLRRGVFARGALCRFHSVDAHVTRLETRQLVKRRPDKSEEDLLGQVVDCCGRAPRGSQESGGSKIILVSWRLCAGYDLQVCFPGFIPTGKDPKY